MIRVLVPDNFLEERTYIVSVLLDEFLGIPSRVQAAGGSGSCWWLCAEGSDYALVLPDTVFHALADRWLQPGSLERLHWSVWHPDTSAQRETLVENAVSAPATPDGWKTVAQDQPAATLDIDVFGTAFLLLSRYEEVVSTVRDEHGRFPAAESLAVRNNFLRRPIVNELLEVLWTSLKSRWPQLSRKQRAFRVIPTHDIDQPRRFPGTGVLQVGMELGRAVKRRSPSEALDTMTDWYRTKVRGKRDPFDSFDWLMDASEEAGLRSVFNITLGGTTKHDRPGMVGCPWFRQRLHHISERGHELGFHPSYVTTEDPAVWNREHEQLRQHFGEGTLQGGRQHYLRFRCPETWRLWDVAGFSWESTLGFSEVAGFRCGICFEYPVFDLRERKRLRLRERPLIVMDTTLFRRETPGQRRSTEEVAQNALELRGRCKRYGGDFVLLWHNNRLKTPQQRELYRALLSGEDSLA